MQFEELRGPQPSPRGGPLLFANAHTRVSAGRGPNDYLFGLCSRMYYIPARRYEPQAAAELRYELRVYRTRPIRASACSEK